MSSPEGEDTADDVLQRLIDEFGTSLDESVIYAVASDYEVAISYNVIRNQLLPLAELAPAEEATGFDPSGLGHLSDFSSTRLDDGCTDDTTLASQSSVTASSSERSDCLDILPFTDQANLSEAQKVDNLGSIFSGFKNHTIKFVLKTTGGDFERAFDELLNRQFLDENGDLVKGVDGFYAPSSRIRRSKGEKVAQQKKTRGNKLNANYTVPLPSADIEELEGALGSVPLPLPTGSRPTPLLKEAGISAAAKQSVWSSNPSRPLSGRNPNPPLSPSLHAAQLVQDQRDDPSRVPKPGWQVVAKKKKAAEAQLPAVVGASANEQVRSNAHTASSLYRKGASNPLYRQAVAVYSERIRKDTRVAQEAASACYDQLVDSQSTRLKVDLHGVPVVDGVRIAKNRARRWWESLAEEERERKAAVDGFTIVTGVGYHSSGGISRLRQAVGTALRNDGWRMQVFSGEFFLTGKG